jgi:hypothetical protein
MHAGFIATGVPNVDNLYHTRTPLRFLTQYAMHCNIPHQLIFAYNLSSASKKNLRHKQQKKTHPSLPIITFIKQKA